MASRRRRHGGGGGRRGGKGSAPGPIAECEYAGGYWRVERPRHDKRKPNSLRTAWSVLESIADLEARIEKAVEEDDFDAAEALNEQVNELRAELESA